VHVWSSAKYTFPLPSARSDREIRALRQRVIDEEIVPPTRPRSSRRRVKTCLVHTLDYVDRFTAGAGETGDVSFPVAGSRQRSYRAAGGRLPGARSARSTTASR
jgi:hypothetical protein